MRQEAKLATAHLSLPRAGIVTNYDPDRYAARVQLQPEGILTGYLPIRTDFAGNGWGDYAPPTIGQVVDVHFQQGGKEAGYIAGCFYSSKTKPLSVPSQERWIVHKSGSFIKLHNDGSVEISASTNMTLSAPNGTFRVVAQNIQMHATTEYRFDANGHGQAWHATLINAYQIGEVMGASHSISAPEIGD